MSRPNILIIHTDEHRWDCLGAAGNPEIHTPHIDALARDGVWFANSFCPYPVCTPSRYSLLTGLYAHQHLGRANHSTIAPGLPTFPRLLREAGYRTAAVGKMHMTPTYLDVGYERLTLAEQAGPGRLDDDYHRQLQDAGLLDAIDLVDQRQEFRAQAPPAYWETYGAMRNTLPEGWDSTSWIGARALEELRGWGAAPNLLFVGFIKPHHPFDPPASWAQRYDPEKLSLPKGWTDQTPAHDLAYHRGYFPNDELTEPAMRRVLAYYYATISQIDHEVGRMVEHLKDRGLYDSTLIVFTSDHGDYMGDHHQILKSGHAYESLLRVPLIIKYPGSAAAGRTDERLVSTVDMAPTLLAQAGVETPPLMSGLNLADAEAARDMVFCEQKPGAFVARSARYKLILLRDESESLFFDLARDPQEFENVYHQPAYAAEIERHRAALFRWHTFETQSPACVDEQAHTVGGPATMEQRDRQRQTMLHYFWNTVEWRRLSDHGADHALDTETPRG
ncbi:MAG: sulfatase [Phycisphaeraceae bacterium]